MKERLANLGKDESAVARLDSILLSAHELAEARVQMLRAEAIADFVYSAWILVRRAAAGIACKSSELADAYAESAMRAGARKRDEYLSRATDIADLERRLRMLQAPHQVPLVFMHS